MVDEADSDQDRLHHDAVPARLVERGYRTEHVAHGQRVAEIDRELSANAQQDAELRETGDSRETLPGPGTPAGPCNFGDFPRLAAQPRLARRSVPFHVLLVGDLGLGA